MFRERRVLGPLQEHFASAYFHTAPAGAFRGTVIIPDGCMDLLFVRGRLTIAGPDRQATLESIRPGTTVVGFRFQPGAASSWLRTQAAELVGVRTPLESFWGSEARALADWVGEASTVEESALRLEQALAIKATRIETPGIESRAIFQLIERSPSPQSRIVRELMDRLAMSERTLRRRCYEAFGFGPKTLQRILRFHRFLQLAGAQRGPALVDLAAQAGYADQSHLTRESRHMAAVTPTEVIAQLAIR